ncbi:MAG: hypothetical protein P8R54_24580 [Myxococcota bacterium]|nr:hypothetical protein [Myxococcota bacterium]
MPSPQQPGTSSPEALSLSASAGPLALLACRRPFTNTPDVDPSIDDSPQVASTDHGIALWRALVRCPG